jgi:hypothetical protein
VSKLLGLAGNYFKHFKTGFSHASPPQQLHSLTSSEHSILELPNAVQVSHAVDTSSKTPPPTTVVGVQLDQAHTQPFQHKHNDIQDHPSRVSTAAPSVPHIHHSHQLHLPDLLQAPLQAHIVPQVQHSTPDVMPEVHKASTAAIVSPLATATNVPQTTDHR